MLILCLLVIQTVKHGSLSLSTTYQVRSVQFYIDLTKKDSVTPLVFVSKPSVASDGSAYLVNLWSTLGVKTAAMKAGTAPCQKLNCVNRCNTSLTTKSYCDEVNKLECLSIDIFTGLIRGSKHGGSDTCDSVKSRAVVSEKRS